MAADEAKLCDVNEGIKRTLTELLNCEAVRSDRAFRTWVQCRLMDTERELRSGRRRRSAPEPWSPLYYADTTARIDVAPSATPPWHANTHYQSVASAAFNFMFAFGALPLEKA
jgi:hypothetical protein